MTRYFVTAIGTDSGKTLVSALLTQALGADYWKPVQCGFPRDTDTVEALVNHPASHFHPEAHLLETPASPHMAARIEGVNLKVQEMALPQTQNTLVIEGAGGCLVPLNQEEFVIDLAPHFGAQLIVVADLYLGSINHTLLTVEAIKARKLPVAGLVFNGPTNPDSEQIILHYSGWPCLLHLPRLEAIGPDQLADYSGKLAAGLR